MKAKIKTCISLGCPKPAPPCRMPTRLGEGGLMLRIFLAVAVLTIAGVTHAANIVGGSALLSGGDATQLETWLGKGTLTMTKIFSHFPGDGKTAADFHAAADGKGETITVIELPPQNGFPAQIIGGYNPQSWNSSGTTNFTYEDAQRTAFLFNLTTGTLQRQKLNPEDVGKYQTYNDSSYGPMFGGGQDIHVDFNLETGYTNPYSYNAILSGGQGGGLTYGIMEVFTLAFVAPSAPSVNTLAALTVTGTGATLNARVTSNQAASTVVFQYSTDPTLMAGVNTTSPAESLPGNASEVVVNKAITGLTPLTTYYFRAVSTNIVGTTNGAILSFLATDASVGYAFSNPTSVGGGYGTFGSEFRVTSDCTLTHLGTYDHGQDGLAANTPVGLWSSSGILLASTTVLTNDPLNGNSRYHQLSSPVTLTADTNYVVGALINNSDPLALEAIPNFVTDPRIAYVSARYRTDYFYHYHYGPFFSGYYHLHEVSGSLQFPSISSTGPTKIGANFLLGPAVTVNNAPVVTLAGADPLTFEASATYSDPGATAGDMEDGTLTPVISGNTVVAHVPGAYAVTWSVTDSAGVSGSATRVVNVVDTTEPVVDFHPNVTVEATSAAGAVVAYDAATATDAVGVTSLTYTQESGTTFPIGITTVAITATDSAGKSGQGTFTVVVRDTTVPVVVSLGDLTVEATGPAGAVVTYAAATASDVVGVTSLAYSRASGATFPIGITAVTVTAEDAAANAGTATFNVTVRDTTAPVVASLADLTVEATSAVGAVVTYAPATATDAVGVTSLTYSQDSGTTFPIGTTTVTVTAKDAAANLGTGSFTVTVEDTTPPVISHLTSAGLFATGASAAISATFSDEVALGSITFQWDDGSSPTVISHPVSPVAVTHSYAAAGVYLPTVTVTDGSGNSVSRSFQYLIIYDPSAGFVTGGGWLNSPAGAYAPNAALAGKAHFGFNSKYKQGTPVPTGELQFSVGSLKFNSTHSEWLVVSGGKAQYKGSGTINGAGNYGFLLTATDSQMTGGGTDRFRIKLWDKNAGDSIVYDNAPGQDDIAGSPTQAIAGGSIVIHK